MYHREPVNKISAIVASQAGCRATVELNRNEIVEKLDDLKRRQVVLKKKLHIKSLSQHVNFRNKYIRYGRKSWWHKSPLLFKEYMQNGENIQSLEQELRLVNRK